MYRNMIEFINNSPCAFFAVENLKKILSEEGFEELFENEAWKIEEGGKYFTIRQGTSLIAFKIPKDDVYSYHAVLTHADSPALKLKPEFETEEKGMKKLLCEKYGSPILDSFFDTPLSVAGQVVIETENGVVEKLVHLENAALIPRTPPHLSKEQGTNVAVDMCPLYSASENVSLKKKIGNILNVDEGKILSHDLYVVPSAKGTVWGENDEFVTAPRLDNLQSVFTSLVGFLNSDVNTCVPVMAVFDSEEIGSGGENGAASTYLSDTLLRISNALSLSDEEHKKALSNSFFVSVDSAHAYLPNHPELFDKNNSPVINSGVAIKYSAAKKYTTTAISAALFKKLAAMAQVPCQSFSLRADLQGGSTLGHISQENVSVLTIDVGAPLLSMHSSLETVGRLDTEYLARALEMFYSVRIERVGDTHIIR